MKIKASALQRLAAKGNFIDKVIASTLARNILQKKFPKREVDVWLEINSSCDPIIQKLLKEKKLYRSEVR